MIIIDTTKVKQNKNINYRPILIVQIYYLRLSPGLKKTITLCKSNQRYPIKHFIWLL